MVARAGWRVDGVRVYHVKGKKASRRSTYSTKGLAKRALKAKLRRRSR